MNTCKTWYIGYTVQSLNYTNTILKNINTTTARNNIISLILITALAKNAKLSIIDG